MVYAPFFIWFAVAMLVIGMGAFAPSVWGRNQPAMRLVLGLVVSPLAGLGIGCLAAAVVLVASYGEGSFPPLTIGAVVVFALFVFPVAQIVFLGFALPFILVARAVKLNLLWVYVPAGCIIGVLTIATTLGFSYLGPAESVFLSALCGGVTMAVFWLIAEFDISCVGDP